MSDDGGEDTDVVTEPLSPGIGGRSRRSDALRNHDRVIAAARELFAEYGLGVTVPQVAERAGVGRATVYRSYPTKEELIAAVAAEHFERLEAHARDALAAPNAYLGFREYLQELFGDLARDRGLATAFFEGRMPPADRLLGLIEQLLHNAVPSGQIRPDVAVWDVRVILCGAVRQLIALGQADPAVWHRYAIMTLNAYRP